MSRHKKLPKEPFPATIESLSHEGRGIAHVNNKVVFIDGTLPGEEVLFEYRNRGGRFDQGKLTRIKKASPERIEPRCRHYGICGGCSLQHLPSDAQLRHKQSVLLEQLEHIGEVQPESVMPPLAGLAWNYRSRARLSAKYVDKKDKMLIGFRERYSPFVADLGRCEILRHPVGELLQSLQELLAGLSIFRQVPQIEVAVADNVTALVLRHLDEFSSEDILRLRKFENLHNIEFYLQPGGPDTVSSLTPEKHTPLIYQLPEYDLEFFFQPLDFIQNNTGMNRKMVRQAIELLAPDKTDRVLDLFCGLGNFSLPLALNAGNVIGIEGDAGLIERAQVNARHNRIDNVEYYCSNLTDEKLHAAFLQQTFQKILLDPPRTGAQEILRQLKFEQTDRLVYVSCNPATMARDAGILVHENGFQLKRAGVVDMFPHTSHLESIALFER